jgi:acetyl-CoA carboxylase biotin carboxyl carrier protein
LDLDRLKDLLQLLEEREIAEFELEEKDLKLRVRKAAHAPAAPPVVAPVLPAILPAPVAVSAAAAALPAPAPAVPPAAPAPVEEEALEVIKSPIVGTFYRSPDPNSPPFVNVGDRIKPGQVLCIVEAMKLMNEIEAESAGEIVKVHKENGQPVQYGEPLFSIRP